MASRLTSSSVRLQRARLAFCQPFRAFSSNQGDRAWKNETPVGSTTEVFVYSPEPNITWPDPRLGILGSSLDPAFSLPGNIGPNPSSTFPQDGTSHPLPSTKQPDVLTSPTNKESQVHALYNANDFIKYTPGSESVVCSSPSLLSIFPALPSSDMLELVPHEAPLLLRKQLADLFPGQKLGEGPATVLTLAIRTQHDMSAWSEEMEEEREKLTEDSVIVAKEICGRLKEEGYWADFIDPCSGTPHYSGHSATTMFETDERYRLLGFRIEDLGCCKVIAHNRFGRNVFVGCVVTNAAAKSDVMRNIVEDISV